jgi:endonuclease YncB( thermonuclease family)
MRALIALLLAVGMASPAFAEPIVGGATVIDGGGIDVRGQPIQLDGVDAPQSGQLCDDGNETSHRCGVGTEWAVKDRVSIKSEALYLRLHDDSFSRTSAVSGAGDTKRVDHVDSVWVGRIGVNFKLGGAANQAR